MARSLAIRFAIQGNFPLSQLNYHTTLTQLALLKKPSLAKRLCCIKDATLVWFACSEASHVEDYSHYE